jgi:hypothetical protein
VVVKIFFAPVFSNGKQKALFCTLVLCTVFLLNLMLTSEWWDGSHKADLPAVKVMSPFTLKLKIYGYKPKVETAAKLYVPRV